jgi:hypothetical protein
MTHCASITVAPRLDCKAGNATFTTVLSIKAMLDPRIAAVRIQVPARGGRGAVAGWDRIAASSQGAFMSAKMIGLSMKVRNIPAFRRTARPASDLISTARIRSNLAVE